MRLIKLLTVKGQKLAKKLRSYIRSRELFTYRRNLHHEFQVALW